MIYAPWRSLLYRNVDNAFAYTDDLALYPHMPMNTPAQKMLAEQLVPHGVTDERVLRVMSEIPRE